MHTLLWFQHDLRVNSNPALEWALAQGKPIIAVYIDSPQEDAPWAPGAASRWWLHHSLEKLSASLSRLGIELHFFKGNSVEVIPRLVSEHKVNSVTWTNRHEPARIKYETGIESLLTSNGVQVKRFQDGLLANPALFLTASKNTPYRVFTPFYKKLRGELDLAAISSALSGKPATPGTSIKLNGASLDELELLDPYPWHEKLKLYWTPGEDSALEQLERFIDKALADYPSGRDFPAIEATSKLSPHLHFGEISPQQIVAALTPLIEMEGGNMASQAEAYLRQLGWPEFARYILWHFPQTVSEPMNPRFGSEFWCRDDTALEKWQRGETGIPIIDAGMKQLWETGWMHNRVRMLVASLLTKNLGIAWQQGAQWFWDTLVDADLANNTMGWQWVAGCGVDAAPYFRIFNPLTQAQKFDKQQQYLARWLHADERRSPLSPIVDLDSSRKDALARYQHFIKNQL